MKIAIDARFLRTSTGRYIERLLEHLQSIDSQNNYVIILAMKDFDSWQPRAANFTKVGTTVPVYSLAEQLRFAWQLYRLRADLVHFTMPNHPILYRKRFVITVHDLSLIDYRDSSRGNFVYSIKHWAFRKIMKSGVERARRVITPTDFVKNQIVERYGVKQEKIVRTYEAAEPLSTGGEAKPAHSFQRYILYVGNAYPRKNLRLLADAFAQIQPRFVDVGLIYVGKMDDFYRQLREYVQEKNMPSVQFTGFISDESLEYLYRHASAYVFPSLSEGFGLPGLEAMQYGVPLLAANATCLPEVYGDAALYFDPHNADDLATKLGQVLSSDDLQAELVERGYARVKSFSWERMAQETLGVYESAGQR